LHWAVQETIEVEQKGLTGTKREFQKLQGRTIS